MFLPAATASADSPDIAFDAQGNAVVTDRRSGSIRIVSPSGDVRPLLDRSGIPVVIEGATAVAIDPLAGDIYISESDEIWRIGRDGILSEVAGPGLAVGSASGGPPVAQETEPALRDVVSIAAGGMGRLYIGTYDGRVLSLADRRLELLAASADARSVFTAGQQPATLPGGPIHAIVAERDGALYVAQGGGVYRIRPDGGQAQLAAKLPQAISQEQRSDFSYEPAAVTGLAMHEGQVYVGTAREGVLRLHADGTLKRFIPADPRLHGGRVDADGNGRLGVLRGQFSQLQLFEFDPSGHQRSAIPVRDLSAKAATARASAGGPPRRDIVGGEEVPESRWQAVVLVGQPDSECSGSLVAPDWVLTAAHCLLDDDLQRAPSAVVSVCHDRTKPAECLAWQVPSRTIVLHDDVFRVQFGTVLGFELGERWFNDLALVQTERPISGVEPIRLLDELAESTYLRDAGLSVGWGEQDHDAATRTSPDIKREVPVEISLPGACDDANAYRQFGRTIFRFGIPIHQLCAGTLEAGISSGDSGGPLLVATDDGWGQVGIVSGTVSVLRTALFGARHFSLYERVSRFHDWIESHVSPASQPAAPADAASSERFRDCDLCPEMTVLEAGRFTMGDDRYGISSPPVPVRIGNQFAIGTREVTFAEWDACVADGGCAAYRPADEGWGRESRPVINVSWLDARAYARWLTETTGRLYRLPSEAEWEYAARAGQPGRWTSGDTWVPAQFNYGASSTRPAGSFAPNAWGLHDMLGNVWEWTEDCWAWTLDDTPADGTASASGDCSRRSVRGGSFKNAANDVNISLPGRNYEPQGDRETHVGMRLVAEVVPDDHGNLRGDATEIASGIEELRAGSTMQGRISPADDIDYFQLRTNTETAVEIWTAGDLDTEGVLIDESGRVIAQEDTGGSGGNFRISARLPAGTYFVRIGSFAGRGAGEYDLHVSATAAGGAGEADDHGDDESTATLLPLDEAVAGRIDPERDIDVFRLDLDTAATVEIFTTGDTDTFGSLDGGLHESDGGGAGFNFRIEADLSRGAHFVRVTSFRSSETGPYAIQARVIASRDPETDAPDLQPGETFRDCDECPEMTVVAAGEFLMGDIRFSASAPPQPIRIPGPFAIGTHEVTFAEWNACADDGGCNAYRPPDDGADRADHPVTGVSWLDAQAYAEWLTAKSGRRYRLPSEAEWEYAARAGQTGRWTFGDAWTPGHFNYASAGTRPVGTYAPNAWGLRDVLGNVWEWTLDCWDWDLDGTPPDASPRLTGACEDRSIRGGSFRNRANSTNGSLPGRNYSPLEGRHPYIGIRLVAAVAR